MADTFCHPFFYLAMNHHILILFLTLLSVRANAQPAYDAKRDFVWIFGRGGWLNDTTNNVYLNFSTDSLQLSYEKHVGQNFYQTNASICDTAGNLLFYSNGCVISDTNSTYIPGADTINKGVRWSTYCSRQNAQIKTDGYVIVNGCWILPVGEHKFKVFYADLINSTAHTSGVRFATVVRDAVTGQLGGYAPDTYLLQRDLQPELRGVVRHANGRDWWMVNSDREDKTFYTSYIDSTDNIYQTDSIYFDQLLPNPFPGGCQGVFSPDGTKYCTVGPYHESRVMDFDRCTGQLSNPIQIELPLPQDSIIGVTGVAISPNSRFMYLMTLWSIWQYDLQANDIEASKIRVAQNDGWLDQYGKPLAFYQSQLGPDGKIYVFPPASVESFTVIEYPDSLGLSCQVNQHKYVFPDWTAVAQPPRFPNFRLGPVVGSPCDTLTSSTTDQAVIQASMLLRPNPATTHTVVDISLPDYSSDMQLSLTVSDLSGNVLSGYQVPPYAALQRIETAALPNGLYFITLYSKGQVLKTERLVVLRM